MSRRRRLLRWARRLLLYPLGAVVVLAAVVSGYVMATLYRPSPRQEGYLALTGATVLVGEDLEPRADVTVIVRDGTIVDVGADVVTPPQATVMDLDGATLMPGLVDLHVHLGSPELDKGEQLGPAQIPGVFLDWFRRASGKRRAFLEHGVTTIRSPGDAYEWITDLRDQVDDGRLEGPRLFVAGPLFTAPGGHPAATLFADDPAALEQVRLPTTPQEARAAVRLLADGDHRVDFIKVVQDRGGPTRRLEPIAPEVLGAIVAEAHDHDLAVFAHWGEAVDLEELLAADVDGLEHIGRLLDGWPTGSLSALVDRDLPLTPTLAVMEVSAPQDAMQQLQQRVGELAAAGGRVGAGSDAGMPGVAFGPGLHRELELLVDSGLTPRQALVAATSGAAAVLGDDHLGAIAPGRAADLVVVDGDPLEDVRVARDVIMVFRDGRLVVDQRGAERRS